MLFYFFSARLFENDFRKHLIEALRDKGHEVSHIRVGRVNILTRSNNQRSEFRGVSGFFELTRCLRHHVKKCESIPIYIDSTGACVPIRSLLLRAALHGIWCFDIFDNLLYGFQGFKRLKYSLSIGLLAWLSRIQLVISREMLRLFPMAHHLENAAHTRLLGSEKRDFSNLVVLFSIDRRFNFEMIHHIATLALGRKIYLYGRLQSPEDRTVRRQFDQLLLNCANVIYRGEYQLDDIDKLLAPFGVGFTPYVTNNALTEYINPDKYYLFLNSGMEVISTDIPQARRMGDSIHLGYSPSGVLELLVQIESDPTFRKNIKGCKGEFTWARRADEFIEIIRFTKSSTNPS